MPSSRFILGNIPWYSVLVLTGICLALGWCMREEKRLGLPKDVTVDLALLVIPFGIIGARLYYVAFAWDMFRSDPLSILAIWNGGLAIYGGVIGGFLAVLLYAWRKKLKLASLCDMIAPGLALAQAVGRWGNFFNMEAYGQIITDPRWQFFPLAVLIPEGGGEVWHQATFFYESIWNVAVFTSLALTRKRMMRRGDIALWYMVLYGAGRLVIEGLRTDSLMTGSGTFRVSQLLSVVLCIVVIGIFGLRAVRKLPGRIALGVCVLCMAALGMSVAFGAGVVVCLCFSALSIAAAAGLYALSNR